MEFEKTVIDASSITSFQVVQAEMEIEVSLAGDQSIWYGLLLDGGFLLLQAMEDEFLRHN